ncbi:MAG TPA: hypothetical protein PLN42_08380, partial [Anaerolineae bacterium]|nr:hypothetical protein [Anaerolineae bacterium]
WEGSDIDLDERFESARQHVEQTTALAARVTEVSAVRPYIARRHLHDTGTVRYFAPWIVELDEVDQVATRPFGVADGAVVFVLTEREQDVEAAVNAAKHASSRLPSPRKERTFFAVPTELEGLRESIDELKVWDWVAENTPELAGDAVARRELSARRIEGRQRFNQLCAHCFDPSSSFRSARWVWRGQESPFTTAAQLASAVSDACDAAYAAAPTVQNELVNRSTLSSSAAAARRTLIELMLAHGADPRLGIRGAPPELSMYRSVLEQSGLHHQTSGGWVFGPKEGWDPCRVGKLWAAIERWLDSTEEAKQPVVALFALLREAPYGIRDGLLPIYLVAAALHWEMELAFYEDGTFVPEPNIAVFERLIKSPERFAVQRHRTGPARSYLFERYAALLGERTPEAGQSSLLRAVRPILSLVRHLPAYAQNTKRLSAAAIAVRGALQTAREPAPLLFAALPQALGYRSMNADTDQAQAQAFFKDLREALRELQRAYDALLEEVGEQFMVAMDLARPLEAARALAAQRAAVLQEQVTETRLRAYVGRLCDRTLADREWLESLAAMLVRKAPKSWADDDLLAYGVELAALAAQFKRVEDIMVESGRRVQADQARWLRVAVTEGSGEERKELLSVLPADERDIEAVATELEAALRRKKVPRRVRLAALGELARRAMNEEPSDSKGDANDH